MWLLTSSISFASTWTVDPSGAGDYLDIAEGIDRAASGDTLLVEPGVYPQRLVIRDKDMILRSTQGPEVTTIRDGWENSLILVDGGTVTVEGFEITSTEIKHCVRVRVGKVTLIDDTIHGCDAYDGLGGGLRTDAGTEAVVESCRFDQNRAHFTIGARAPHIYARGDRLEVRNSSFTLGHSDGDCGGVMVIGGDNILENNRFEGNVATDDGGGFYADGRPTDFLDGTKSDGAQSVTLVGNTFVGNVAGDRGGAMFFIGMEDRTYDVRSNVVCGNDSTGRGGGVYVESAPVDGLFWYNVVQENVSAIDQGGGMFVLRGAATVLHNDFVANSAGDRGGGFSFKDASLVFRHNLVSDTVIGDGLWAQFGVTVDDLDYNGWWNNLPANVAGVVDLGAHDVIADPRLASVSFDRNCDNDDWTPTSGSPLIDGGDATEPDPDGSPADIGAVGRFGAPDGPPGAGGGPGGTTDTGAADEGGGAGCGCASGPGGSAGSGWWLGIALGACAGMRAAGRRSG